MPRHSPLTTHLSAPSGRRPRVAFVTSHPIQYQVPVFRELAKRTDLDFVVLFAMLPDAASQGAGFGVAFEWDIPLLEGYNYRVLKNVASSPGVTHFKGCDTPGIKSVLRELQIDVVVVNGWVVKTCLQTLWACKRLGIPCIVRGEANNLRHRPWWKRILQRRLVRRFDAFLPIGKANRQFYRSHGISDDKMFDAPYCVENERFATAALQADPQRNELRSRWHIPENAVCFLFCGKFETKKHPVELVQAFQSACSQLSKLSEKGSDPLRRPPKGQTPFRIDSDSEPASHSPIHLLMVGDGELRARCAQLASRISPLATITFAGFLNQTHIIESYVAADLLVLPSDAGETWGLVANEAMACGKPVIVSDQVGCAKDLVVTGQTGWIFKFGDFGSLSQIMTEIAANPEILEPMRSFCQRKIAEYSPQVASQGIIQAVRALIHSRTNM